MRTEKEAGLEREMAGKILIVVFCLSWLVSCNKITSRPASSTTPEVFPDLTIEAPSPEQYLMQALDILQGNSINRHQVDWADLRADALRWAAGAQTTADTYDAIQITLQRLGDRHSFFMTPAEWEQMRTKMVEASPDPTGKFLEEGLGYVFVAGFASGEQAQIDRYATSLQTIIREVDAGNPCGWVVDLRENTGGNMWPMLAGLGPLLGEECVGSFIDPDGQKSQWCYEDGQAFNDGQVLAQVTEAAYQLSRSQPPVAVLTSSRTGSSGEALVVAFRGRPHTRSFGQGTYGLSTGNQGFPLPDGAWIFLTVSTFADRAGEVYGGIIQPDEVLTDAASQAVPQEPRDWLLSQPACSAGS